MKYACLEGMQRAIQTRGPLNIYFTKWRAATGMQYILDEKILACSREEPVHSSRMITTFSETLIHRRWIFNNCLGLGNTENINAER
jgi:hypothetical protein